MRRTASAQGNVMKLHEVFRMLRSPHKAVPERTGELTAGRARGTVGLKGPPSVVVGSVNFIL